MNYRIPEKVILRRVLAFYLTTILETGTGVKKKGYALIFPGERNCLELSCTPDTHRIPTFHTKRPPFTHQPHSPLQAHDNHYQAPNNSKFTD